MLAQIITPTASSIPIFWGHSTSDPRVNHDQAFGAASKLAQDLDVPIRMGAGGKPALNPKDAGIQFNSYSGLAHWIDPVGELADLRAWIKGVLPE
jgi:hypothetical protein